MADTVTPKLGFTKPEVGASNNTWGTKTNGNWDIIDGKMVYNTIQWHITMGDELPASTTGPFVITRYGNDGLRIDDPLTINRQSGVTNIAAIGQPYRAPPATPPANVATIFVDVGGNPCLLRPDGTVQYLGTPPGAITYTAGSAADVGWALCNGQGVDRASNPGLSLKLPVGMYGGTAATIILPDIRGRVVAHVDGGTGRLATAFNGNALGATGGLDYHYLTAAQMANHRHSWGGAFYSRAMGSWQHNHGVSGGVYGGTLSFQRPRDFAADATIPYSASAISINNAELSHQHITDVSGNTSYGNDLDIGNSWHPNAQPTIVLNAQIKLG